MKINVLIASLALAGSAYAHFDVRPRVENSKIVTDGSDDGTGDFVAGLRVFGYDFGENVDDPFFVQDPGFNAPSGSGLPAGSQLKFNLLSALSFWDGTGAVDFAPVATGESLKIEFGASSRTVSGGSGPQTGFAIQTVGAGGTIHRHLNAFLNGPDGNTVPAGPGSWGAGDGIQAADGIYLFSLELLLDPSTGIANSNPLFIVFNNGLSEAVHDEAMDWVTSTYVPEPAASVGLLVLAGVVAGRRR